MTKVEFTRYWIIEQTPMTAAVPGLRAYHCYPMANCDDVKPPFDAVAFVAFEGETAWRNALASAQFQITLREAPNVQQTEATIALNAREYEIV